MIVLDTHVLVWTLQDDSKLGPGARTLIDEQIHDAVLIPAISVWEIALLVKKGRLGLNSDMTRWIGQALDLPGVFLAPLEPSISIDSVMLPGEFHNDPADRLIVATARYHEAPLLTMDRAILDYANAGHVQAIDANL
jgi:PIN domain nuclease of toxin-antitoxin system